MKQESSQEEKFYFTFGSSHQEDGLNKYVLIRADSHVNAEKVMFASDYGENFAASYPEEMFFKLFKTEGMECINEYTYNSNFFTKTNSRKEKLEIPLETLSEEVVIGSIRGLVLSHLRNKELKGTDYWMGSDNAYVGLEKGFDINVTGSKYSKCGDNGLTIAVYPLITEEGQSELAADSNPLFAFVVDNNFDIVSPYSEIDNLLILGHY